MPAYLDALANANQRIKDLQRMVLSVAVLGVVGMALVKMMPVRLQLNLSPSLRAGETVEFKNGVASVPTPNVYAFGYYIWQQVNRWSSNGQKDYGQQIFNVQNFLTPSCLAQLTADVHDRNVAGELASRTRTVGEAPGQRYATWRVKTEAEDAWTVVLDLEVNETIGGVPVKSAYIRYPVRVVRYDIDPEKNSFGLAVDCFGSSRPERIQAAELGQQVLASGTADPSQRAAPTPPPTRSANPAAPAPPIEPSRPVPTQLPKAAAY